MAERSDSAQSGSRPRQCPARDLRPGDVIEVYVCIENDDYDWVKRTVAFAYPEQLTLLDGDREYSVPIREGDKYRLAYVDRPLVWEGEGA